MTAAQSPYRKFGRLELPLQRTRARDLRSLDPAHQILLDLFAAAIACELEPVWADAVIGSALRDSEPVQQKLPALPEAEVLGQMKVGWPLLAVGPSDAAAGSEPFSIDQNKLTQRWDVDFILCPQAIAGEIKFGPVLRAVAKILRLTVLEGGHRAYLTRTNGNFEYAANVLTDNGDDCCGFYACRVVESATGIAKFVKDGPRFLSASITLESEEISDFLAGDEDGESVPFDGATADFGYDGSGTPSIIART
jgi:hypothetical protein